MSMIYLLKDDYILYTYIENICMWRIHSSQYLSLGSIHFEIPYLSKFKKGWMGFDLCCALSHLRCRVPKDADPSSGLNGAS